MKRVLAVLLCCISVQASASVLLDFDGVQGSVNDYYNGGTDSAGNSGANYGIRFSGGTVVDGRIQGAFTVTFAPRSDLSFITFQATRWDIDGGNSYVYGDAPYALDAIWVGGTANPYCARLTPQQCIDDGWVYIPPTRLFDYRAGMLEGVNRIAFTTSLLDNLSFAAPSWAATGTVEPDGTVPEPATLALLGLGAIGLMRRRSARSA